MDHPHPQQDLRHRAAQGGAPLPALAAGLEEKYDGISPFVTPRGDFYRVDTNLTVPVVDVDSWKLTIDGDVDKKVSFTFDELTKMDVVEHDITLTCVSNEVGGKLVGSARWLGVPLRTCSTGRASATRPTRSSAPPSTASRSARR